MTPEGDVDVLCDGKMYHKKAIASAQLLRAESSSGARRVFSRAEKRAGLASSHVGGLVASLPVGACPICGRTPLESKMMAVNLVNSTAPAGPREGDLIGPNDYDAWLRGFYAETDWLYFKVWGRHSV